jgi:hypothetical protein
LSFTLEGEKKDHFFLFVWKERELTLRRVSLSPLPLSDPTSRLEVQLLRVGSLFGILDDEQMEFIDQELINLGGAPMFDALADGSEAELQECGAASREGLLKAIEAAGGDRDALIQAYRSEMTFLMSVVRPGTRDVQNAMMRPLILGAGGPVGGMAPKRLTQANWDAIVQLLWPGLDFSARLRAHCQGLDRDDVREEYADLLHIMNNLVFHLGGAEQLRFLAPLQRFHQDHGVNLTGRTLTKGQGRKLLEWLVDPEPAAAVAVRAAVAADPVPAAAVRAAVAGSNPDAGAAAPVPRARAAGAGGRAAPVDVEGEEKDPERARVALLREEAADLARAIDASRREAAALAAARAAAAQDDAGPRRGPRGDRRGEGAGATRGRASRDDTRTAGAGRAGRRRSDEVEFSDEDTEGWTDEDDVGRAHSHRRRGDPLGREQLETFFQTAYMYHATVTGWMAGRSWRVRRDQYEAMSLGAAVDALVGDRGDGWRSVGRDARRALEIMTRRLTGLTLINQYEGQVGLELAELLQDPSTQLNALPVSAAQLQDLLRVHQRTRTGRGGGRGDGARGGGGRGGAGGGRGAPPPAGEGSA